MLIFLTVFFSIYSAMHALFFFRTRCMLPASVAFRFLFIAFLVCMIAAPVMSRMLERMGHDITGRMVGIIGYYWMGFIFLAFTGIVLTLLYDLLAWGIRTITDYPVPFLSGKPAVTTLIVLVIAICLYGAYEARELKIETLRIVTEKLPADVDRFRIVQISDIHIGLMTREKRLKAITDAVQSTRPDLIVCTGDLVDGRVDHLNGLSELLVKLDAPYGKYAVTGNHEFYVGINRSSEFIQKSGFTLLRDQSVTLNPLLNIVGEDDPTLRRSANVNHILKELSRNGLFTLFLKHRPVIGNGSEGLFDLQLSGHTHRGQIFPFNYLVALVYPLLDGHYPLEDGSHLYTSRGSGTWGPPMRVLSPPEITVVELVQSNHS